jgi:hypothetical protein
VSAYHRRLEDAEVLCSAAGVTKPVTPTDPHVPAAAEFILRILGHHDKETSSELVPAG